MSTQACTRPAESHGAALTGHVGRAGRKAAQEALRRARWHLRQRRPRPTPDDTIDHALSAVRNLVLIAVLIAIGG